MDEKQKEQLLIKLNARKEQLNKHHEDDEMPIILNSRELNDSIRMDRLHAQQLKEEKEKKRLKTLCQLPATIERLSNKTNFGTYQLDMVRMFRKIILEIDHDQSGEIEKSEFMLAIEKIHDHEDQQNEKVTKQNHELNIHTNTHRQSSLGTFVCLFFFFFFFFFFATLKTEYWVVAAY